VPETVSEDRGRQPVGEYLREIRESRGLTLDDAASVTRIGKNYLQSIEEERFDKLPSPAYVKGFLRVYAGYLGLSGDEVVDIFEGGAGSRPLKAGEKPTSSPGRGGARQKKGFQGRWFISSVLFVLICAVAFLFREKEERVEPQSAPPPAPQATAAPVAGIQPRLSTATGPAPASDVAAPPTTDTPATGKDVVSRGIILRVKANQDGPLTITIDGNLSQQYDMKAGDIIEWKGERVFTLDLGNAGGVEAELNGRRLNSFGEAGKPAHVIVKDDSAAESKGAGR